MRLPSPDGGRVVMVNLGQSDAGSGNILNRATWLVLCENTATAQATINSLRLERASLIEINELQRVASGVGALVHAPEAALLIGSDIAVLMHAIRAVKRRWHRIRVVVDGLPTAFACCRTGALPCSCRFSFSP